MGNSGQEKHNTVRGMFFKVVYFVYDYEEWLISLTAKSCYTV